MVEAFGKQRPLGAPQPSAPSEESVTGKVVRRHERYFLVTNESGEYRPSFFEVDLSKASDDVRDKLSRCKADVDLAEAPVVTVKGQICRPSVVSDFSLSGVFKVRAVADTPL